MECNFCNKLFSSVSSLNNHKIIFDGRNLFDVSKMIELGYYYESIGRSGSEKLSS